MIYNLRTYSLSLTPILAVVSSWSSWYEQVGICIIQSTRPTMSRLPERNFDLRVPALAKKRYQGMGHSWEQGWLEDFVKDLRIIYFEPTQWGFFLRHMIIHGHLISLRRGCIVFCCRDFLEVFRTDDTRLTWSPTGLYFLLNNHSFQSNPMAVIILMVNTPRFLWAMLCFPVTYHDLPLHWLKQ